MEDYSKQHKKAWEFDAYDFWVRTAGTPEERALKDKENPKKMLKQYANYFDFFAGVKVANICGSCGKKAILAYGRRYITRILIMANSP